MLKRLISKLINFLKFKMNGINAVCIFCGRSNIDVKFNREHIIPHNIGGNLFLDNCVCADCNSYLGANADHEILKLPEILTAFEQLAIPHDKEGIIKNYYKITGQTDDNLTLNHGKYKDGQIIFPKQKVSDDSIIAPEKDYFENLRKIVAKDKRLKSAGLTEAFITRKIDELKTKYDKAQTGEIVHSPELGWALKKRKDKPKTKILPKSEVNMIPLLAKIAYEYLFFIGGSFFFLDESLKLQNQLFQTIKSGELKEGLYVMRETPLYDDYKPVHLMRVEFRPDYTIVRIVFFGHIQYLVMGNRMSEKVHNNIEKFYKIKGITTLDFQQDLDKPSKSFWAFTSDDKLHRLI